MEKILEQKKLQHKDILTQDCNSKEKNIHEIQIKQLTGLRKRQNNELIMERRKQYSLNNKKSNQIDEDIKLEIYNNILNSTLVNYLIKLIGTKS
jgi:hypothetical protein